MHFFDVLPKQNIFLFMFTLTLGHEGVFINGVLHVVIDELVGGLVGGAVGRGTGPSYTTAKMTNHTNFNFYRTQNLISRLYQYLFKIFGKPWIVWFRK